MKHARNKGKRGDDAYSPENEVWGDTDPSTLWSLFETYRNNKERLSRHLRGLAQYIIDNPLTALDVLFGEDEEFDRRWGVVHRIVKTSLLGTGDDERKRGKAKEKKVDELRAASLLLIKGLSMATDEEVVFFMADEEEGSNSYLQILLKFLQHGYQEANGEEQRAKKKKEKERDEGEEGGVKHSPSIHAKALKTLAWLLFCCDSPTLTKEFLQSCAKYFVESDAQEQEKELDSESEGGRVFFAQERNDKVMVAAMKSWVFLLSTIEDEEIHALFDFTVLSSVNDLLGDENPKVKAQAACLILLLLSLDMEYPYLDDVSMTKEKYLSQVKGLRGIHKKESQLFEGLLAALEGTETHEAWLVNELAYYGEHFKVDGWRAKVKLSSFVDQIGNATMGTINASHDLSRDHLLHATSLFFSTRMRQTISLRSPRPVPLQLRLVKINKKDLEGGHSTSRKWQKRVNTGPNFLGNNKTRRNSWDDYSRALDSHENRKDLRKVRAGGKNLDDVVN